MGRRAGALASMAIITTLAAVTACGSSTPGACAGQCRPPFQLQVTFRPGTSQQAAAAAMRNCRHQPLVIRIGQPSYSTPGQQTATIYTSKLPTGATHIPLLTCLRHSPVVLSAGWPD